MRLPQGHAAEAALPVATCLLAAPALTPPPRGLVLKVPASRGGKGGRRPLFGCAGPRIPATSGSRARRPPGKVHWGQGGAGRPGSPRRTVLAPHGLVLVHAREVQWWLLPAHLLGGGEAHLPSCPHHLAPPCLHRPPLPPSLCPLHPPLAPAPSSPLAVLPSWSPPLLTVPLTVLPLLTVPLTVPPLPAVLCWALTRSLLLTCLVPAGLLALRYYYSRKVVLAYLDCALHTDMADIEQYYMKPPGEPAAPAPLPPCPSWPLPPQ